MHCRWDLDVGDIEISHGADVGIVIHPVNAEAEQAQELRNFACTPTTSV